MVRRLHPRKNLDEASFISVLIVPNNNMRLGKHHVLAPIDLPTVREDRLKLRLFAGLDVVRNQHRLRVGLRAVARVSRRTAGQYQRQNNEWQTCRLHKMANVFMRSMMPNFYHATGCARCRARLTTPTFPATMPLRNQTCDFPSSTKTQTSAHPASFRSQKQAG